LVLPSPILLAQALVKKGFFVFGRGVVPEHDQGALVVVHLAEFGR
jgi:hypothetical protein